MIGTVWVSKSVGSNSCVVECWVVIIATYVIGIAIEGVVSFKARIQINLGIAKLNKK
jgi:hypothetical protein